MLAMISLPVRIYKTMAKLTRTGRTLLVAVIAVLGIAAGYILFLYAYPSDLGDHTVSIIIEPGDSFVSVADRIVAQDVVRSRALLMYPARWREIDKKLVPGRYDFTGKNSCRSVLARLEDGDFLRVRVTVYEGATIWTVASRVAKDMPIDSAVFQALNTDSAFCDALGIPCLEGYLWPDTYIFPWGISGEDVARQMVSTFKARTDSIWPDSIPNGLSREELLILASIVEAEAKLDEEKPIIASVYHNRLRRKWRLDADPTVIYGLGGLDRPLWRRDLRKDTPYNTYKRRGLPPTPINSPGMAAIEAALAPAETDYFFFVADGTGGHRFSKTNAEHNRARHEIKRNRAD